MPEVSFYELLERTKDKRQLRLFAVACCRNIWHLLTDPRSKDAVEVVESFADGLVSEEELNSASDAAWAAWHAVRDLASAAARDLASAAARDVRDLASAATWAAANGGAWTAANGAAWYTAWAVESATANVTWDAERKQQLVFLKDIINQPSVKLKPSLHSWNNSLLLKFSTNIYTNRDFTLMPILADALEDANAPITFIEHCRSKVHVKGCWLIDVLMGKR